MLNVKRIDLALATLSFLSFSAHTWAGDEHGHAADVVVGRNGAGQLAVEFDFAAPIALSPVNGLLTGWAGDEPGFMSLVGDEPDEDFFEFESAAQVVFELVSIDSTFKVWSPGFTDILNMPGEQFIIGGNRFDVHPTFHIDMADPLFDPSVETFAMSFRLLDIGATGYAPSPTLHTTFVPVPEPTSLLLLSVGLFALARRRVRQPNWRP